MARYEHLPIYKKAMDMIHPVSVISPLDSIAFLWAVTNVFRSFKRRLFPLEVLIEFRFPENIELSVEPRL